MSHEEYVLLVSMQLTKNDDMRALRGKLRATSVCSTLACINGQATAL